jgi:deoxycytidylate deaminase
MELIEVSKPEDDSPIWASLKGEAQKSLMKFKIGAALIRRGRIVAVSHNTTKTHPKFGSKKDFKTLHAEGNVIWTAKKLGIPTQGLTIMVYRRNWLNSKPCESCQKLIKKAGIAKVIYTNNEQGCLK